MRVPPKKSASLSSHAQETSQKQVALPSEKQLLRQAEKSFLLEVLSFTSIHTIIYLCRAKIKRKEMKTTEHQTSPHRNSQTVDSNRETNLVELEMWNAILYDQ